MDSDRQAYFIRAINSEKNVFLDPDTGVKTNNNSNEKEGYVMLDELEAIVKRQPKLLTLVFDQSVARGCESRKMQHKLDLLCSKGIYGITYVSYACFILLSCVRSLILNAYNTILQGSRLPNSRFILKGAA